MCKLKKTLVIINPCSGKGNGLKTYQKLCAYVEKHNIKEVEYKLTQYKGHAIEIASGISNEYERVIVVGGDGTLNEVINGLPFSNETVLGLLPVGSGNDFARNLNLPNSITKLLALIFDESPKTICSDIALVKYTNCKDSSEPSERRFINSLGVGFDAYVAHLNQASKILWGSVSYIVAILRAFIKMDTISFTATIDDNKLEGEKLFLTFCNGKTEGGGLGLTPKALISDNYLDYGLVDKVSRFELLKALPAIKNNRAEEFGQIKMGQFSSADILLKDPYYLHVDGEIISEKAKHISISLEDKKIKFICN